ncbi:MAG: DUF72 domain-containing protein [archaeon GB-1867-005]|nr:DUF72 domain-containing protein [Candidatus Culexmicrobium cathedralense]
MLIRVGCCGWAVRGGKAAYFQVFKLIELQSTFYKLPRVSTAMNWRSLAPPDFEFALKAWQVITHPPSSPTWRRAGIKPEPGREDRYGFLRPTEENFEAWRRTLEVCRALKARVCVVQTPPSFGFSDENVKNVRDFFSSIERDGLNIAWEPRGTWNDHLDVVRDLCDSLNLIHAVDVFRRNPVSSHPICYIRLHGIGRGEVNYRYKYTDEDLRALLVKVDGLLSSGFKEVYVLFNNVHMAEDALRFMRLVESGLS